VPKRPRFSRWRRLPGVFRSGDHRPPNAGNEIDRIILYVPAAILDLAEKLAEKEGAATVQDYCAQLLVKAVDDARVRHKVADFEARRGPLEGLKEIASDPDYLAEWQERQDRKPGMAGPPHTPDIASGAGSEEGGLVFIDEPDRSALEDHRPDPHAEPESGEETKPGSGGEPLQIRIELAARPAPTSSLKPLVLLMNNESALDVLGRHVGSVLDDWGFLPCLRRGEAVPAAKVSELARALGELEEELRGDELLDRRTAHALHRLALESQVLLTDAWPGAFDDNAVAAIRTIQEAVERILSGADIRYYAAPAEPGSERTL
jgi:hypothetical protein